MGTHGFIVGVLSDTHGHLDPRVQAAFEGTVDHIVHAGDVGALRVLLELEAIAPVTVVRGNTDPVTLGEPLEQSRSPLLGGIRLFVTHDPSSVRAASLPADTAVVVTGHTHRPLVERRGGVLYVNPGSAYRPRGPEGCTVALLTIDGPVVQAHILPLDVS